MGTILAIIGIAIPVAIILAVVSSAEKKSKEEKRKQRKLEREEIERSGREAQVNEIVNAIKPHLRTLAIKRMQKVQVDDYGIEDNTPWREEIKYFFNNKIKTLPGNKLHIDGNEIFEIFEQEVTSSKYFTDASSIQQSLDSADPYQYEHLCAQLTIKDGWKSRATTGSGDQGVDVICEKDGKMVVIQCKKYTGNVGNKAVQEIHAGKSFHKADHAVVVTNSDYTQSAKTLANSLGVKLLKESHLTDLSAHL